MQSFRSNGPVPTKQGVVYDLASVFPGFAENLQRGELAYRAREDGTSRSLGYNEN